MTTKTEQAELEELGMSEEQLAERRRTLAATLAATPTAQPDAPAGRKTRSDAGKPRPVKPVAAVPTWERWLSWQPIVHVHFELSTGKPFRMYWIGLYLPMIRLLKST